MADPLKRVAGEVLGGGLPRSIYDEELEALLPELYVLIDDQALPRAMVVVGAPSCPPASCRVWRWPRCGWVTTVNGDGSGTHTGTPTCEGCFPTCLSNPGTTRG